ncbi:hypothetical protein, partial [Enterobacter cloacae]|uniref:hypothetical protein n=1 Tax=Enterobacter cloacae TaxID=550 RepID=UPI001F21B268
LKLNLLTHTNSHKHEIIKVDLLLECENQLHKLKKYLCQETISFAREQKLSSWDRHLNWSERNNGKGIKRIIPGLHNC